MAWILVKSTMLRPAAIVLVWQGKIPLDIVFSPREAFNRYIVLLSLSSSVPISCRPMWRSGWRRLTEYSTGFSKLLSKSHKGFTYQFMLFDLRIKKIESHSLIEILMRLFWWQYKILWARHSRSGHTLYNGKQLHWDWGHCEALVYIMGVQYR